ncbi:MULTISPECIES: hypothetical protein [Ensifer]|jgi:hypothetical protein|uniref:RNA-binding protein n=1 Tax=Ensifer canadensis TaxID=555315 RepID=A0AAW4FX95_9HYPH|nr:MULTISPECIES: hypothetical protein [Ensifer]MDP9633821.1 hypothetical protein [Ensifer adhaerens]KQU79371.1 hypothetical protein ASD00_36625 [Ensifer sp. Root31]KQY65991.1 hypothetical protein ASD52_34920 [Ensifer sp. Root142]MBD9491688.1 hypothetical protein [Ensifer sp. ENS11]MBM3095900.1 hypothetical protein [Ensifer canadensis]
MAIHFDQSGFELAPEQLDTLQRIFDRICFETRIPRQDIRAGRLAKFLMDEFRFGNTDELALTECGRWFCRRASPTRRIQSEQQPTSMLH